jgi:hypothetical protein
LDDVRLSLTGTKQRLSAGFGYAHCPRAGLRIFRTPLNFAEKWFCGAATELLALVSNNIADTKVELNSSLPSRSSF